MKIVITMTSWTKRIQYVAKSIYRFFRTQTVKPDVFYLWLAESEFPHKEKDLPEDLRLIIEAFDIQLRWTKENEYCFKRWYVFPEHWQDLVISIDDDINYDSKLIETVVNTYTKNKMRCIIHYYGNGGKVQIRDRIKYCPDAIRTGNDSYNYFMGQCAWTPCSYPLKTLEHNIVAIRKKVCPKCDESFLHPFIIKNNIPIVFVNGLKQTENKTAQNVAIRVELHSNYVTINGHRIKNADLYKYLVLKSFPDLADAWKQVFPNYDLNYFGNMTVDDILKVIGK